MVRNKRKVEQSDIGKKYNFLTIVNIDKENPYKAVCKCDCGNCVSVYISRLISGHNKSCGCSLGKELAFEAHVSHGLSKHPLYKTWNNITQRCGKHHNYKNIKVCNEWKNDFVNFYTWAVDNGYKKGLTIDRIDFNGNYCPKNCRWVSQKEQTRNTSVNHFIEICGIRMCVVDWCSLLGMRPARFYKRLRRGVDEVDALLRPSKLCKDELENRKLDIIRLIARHRNKNGAEDIKKAIQYCQFILERKYNIKSEVKYNSNESKD